MIKYLLIACLVLSAVSLDYTFDDYVQEFSKTYANEEEFNYRKSVFQDNYKAIVEWNANPNAEYKQKPSIWTDHTISEISKFCCNSENWKKVNV